MFRRTLRVVEYNGINYDAILIPAKSSAHINFSDSSGDWMYVLYNIWTGDFISTTNINIFDLPVKEEFTDDTYIDVTSNNH